MNACHCPTETAPARELDETIHCPQFRITDNADGTSVSIALPGVRKEDLKLTLLESSLRMEASRHDEVPENWKTHRDTDTVRRYGLDLRLGSRLDGTRTTASLDAGVLKLQVPVREEAKPRQIPVS